MAGDRMLNDDGSWAEVVSVAIEAKPLKAYNLTVADFHTYFVAGDADADPVWVHNNCFGSQSKLMDHFRHHASDFGAKNPTEYQQMASNFLTGQRGSGVIQKVRQSNGDIMRFDPSNNTFGVITNSGV